MRFNHSRGIFENYFNKQYWDKDRKNLRAWSTTPAFISSSLIQRKGNKSFFTSYPIPGISKGSLFSNATRYFWTAGMRNKAKGTTTLSPIQATPIITPHFPPLFRKLSFCFSTVISSNQSCLNLRSVLLPLLIRGQLLMSWHGQNLKSTHCGVENSCKDKIERLLQKKSYKHCLLLVYKLGWKSLLINYHAHW